MAEYNVKINVKTDTGYDQLYPKSKSDIIDFDKTNSNLSSTNVEAAIKEVNTKANTNKTNIGTLTSLTTDSKTNLVGAINEVDSHTNTAQSTANTNKTNIGTLSSLKTAIKTTIVNAINSLYDAIIGKTLKSLYEVEVATEEGFYVDSLAIKELINRTKWKLLSNQLGTTVINLPDNYDELLVLAIADITDNFSKYSITITHELLSSQQETHHFKIGSYAISTYNSEVLVDVSENSIQLLSFFINGVNRVDTCVIRVYYR